MDWGVSVLLPVPLDPLVVVAGADFTDVELPAPLIRTNWNVWKRVINATIPSTATCIFGFGTRSVIVLSAGCSGS